MAEISKFQKLYGCSACIHASEKDPNGKEAASYGTGFWCNRIKKPVDSKDGSECEHWQYESD